MMMAAVTAGAKGEDDRAVQISEKKKKKKKKLNASSSPLSIGCDLASACMTYFAQP